MSRRCLNGHISAMVMALLIIFIMISCSSKGEKEKAPTMQQYMPAEMLGWKAQPATEEYDRETIFDYINGAGEVYLSYGFQKVDVVRFAKDGAPEITVEIFDMNKPEDAYGVFTHSRESEETGIGGGYEYRGSLLSFWKGKYFICVLSEEETPEAKEAVFALARDIDGKIKESGARPQIVGFLPTANLSQGSVRFFHSHPSLNYHYFLAEDNVLLLNQQTQAVIGQYNPGGVSLLCIQYPDSVMAQAGYDSFVKGYLPEGAETGAGVVENHRWVVAERSGRYVMIVFDVKHEMAGRTLLKECREIIEASEK